MEKKKKKSILTAQAAAQSAAEECNTVSVYLSRLAEAIERRDERAEKHYKEIIGDEINHALVFLLAICAKSAEITVPEDGLEDIDL